MATNLPEESEPDNDNFWGNQALLDCLKEFRAEYPDIDLFDLALLDNLTTLETSAKNLLESYHEDREEAGSDFKAAERGILTARAVVTQSGGLRIEWLKQKPVRAGVQTRSGSRVFSDRIKQTGFRTSRAEIKKAMRQSYELQLFDYYERKFCVIREASQLLGKLRRNLRAYRKRKSQID